MIPLCRFVHCSLLFPFQTRHPIFSQEKDGDEAAEDKKSFKTIAADGGSVHTAQSGKHQGINIDRSNFPAIPLIALSAKSLDPQSRRVQPS